MSRTPDPAAADERRRTTRPRARHGGGGRVADAAISYQPSRARRSVRAHGASFRDLLDEADSDRLIAHTRGGVQVGAVRDLAELLRRPVAEVGAAIGLSRATLTRKLGSGAILPLPESDRLVRFVRLWRRAVELWESDEAAAEWLTRPERSLGGETPFQHAETEVGARRVEDLLDQIAHGIPS